MLSQAEQVGVTFWNISRGNYEEVDYHFGHFLSFVGYRQGMEFVNMGVYTPTVWENYQTKDNGGWENYQVSDGVGGWENYQVVD